MTIAELFIKLGITGTEENAKKLKETDKGMKDIGSTALATKAAIIGMVVGLERLTGYASQVGMDLHKFNVTTGLSTEELQKWQYAAMRFDVSGEEMSNTIRGVQNSMSDMLMGKGSPEALGLLADKVGFDPARARDTFYVMSKIQEFAKKMPPDIASNLLKSFGISDNMFQALKSMDLAVDKISKKHIISEGEIKRLKDINIAWKDFWFSLKTMGIKFIAAEGIQGIKILTNAFKGLTTIGKMVSDLTKKFVGLKGVLMIIGAAVAAYFAPITVAVAGLIYLLSEFQKYKEGKENLFSTVGEGANKAVSGVTGWFKGGGLGNMLGAGAESIKGGLYGAPSAQENASPNVIPINRGQGGGTNMTQTNTFHIDGAESPEATADAVQKAISQTARQMSSQRGGI